MGYANGMGRLQVVRSAEPDALADVARRIGILIFEDFSLVEVSSISEVFSLANQVHCPASAGGPARTPNYSLMFLSSDGGSVASSRVRRPILVFDPWQGLRLSMPSQPCDHGSSGVLWRVQADTSPSDDLRADR